MCRIVISFFPLGQALVHGEALVADEGVFLRPRRSKSESHHSGIRIFPENQNPIKLPTHRQSFGAARVEDQEVQPLVLALNSGGHPGWIKLILWRPKDGQAAVDCTEALLGDSSNGSSQDHLSRERLLFSHSPGVKTGRNHGDRNDTGRARRLVVHLAAGALLSAKKGNAPFSAGTTHGK